MPQFHTSRQGLRAQPEIEGILKALVREVEADPDEHIEDATAAEIIWRAEAIILDLGG